jgi:hypothetical protein
MLISAHAYLVTRGDAYAGPLLIFDHLFDVALTVGLFALCAAVGLYLLALFRFTLDEALEALLFSVAIGCGALAVSILVIGFLFVLHGIALAGLAALWLLVARKEIFHLRDLVRQAAADFNAQSSRFGHVVFAIVGAFVVSQALLPPRDWDALMYHLRVPAQFLEKGGFFVPEDNSHVAFVQLVHMLYLPLLEVGSLAGPALLNAVFALLLGLAVFTFARRFFGEPTASLSLTVLWAGSMLLLVAITPRVDVTLAYFLLLGQFALFLAWENWRFYYLAAVLLGLAFGVKYNALLYLAVLTPLIVYGAFCKARSIGATIRHLVCFGFIFIGTALPWLLKNWLLLGAPLYPFFAQRRINSWLSFVYPDLVFSESLNPKILTMLGDVRTSLNLWNLLFNPSVLTVETEALRYYLNPLFLCLGLWLIRVPRDRVLNWLLIPAVGYVAVLLLVFPKTNLRYLIPIIAPLTIGAVNLAVRQSMKIGGSQGSTIAMHLIALVVLWPTFQTMAFWTVKKELFPYLAGIMSRNDYLARDVFPPEYHPAAKLVTYVNRHLKSTDRILMLFEARGLYFRVPVIQDNVLVNWPLLANKLPEIGCLEASAISYVLVNGGALSFYLERGLDPDVVRWKEFYEFADRCLSPVYQGVGHILYEVKHTRASRNLRKSFNLAQRSRYGRFL